MTYVFSYFLKKTYFFVFVQILDFLDCNISAKPKISKFLTRITSHSSYLSIWRKLWSFIISAFSYSRIVRALSFHALCNKKRGLDFVVPSPLCFPHQTDTIILLFGSYTLPPYDISFIITVTDFSAVRLVKLLYSILIYAVVRASIYKSISLIIYLCPVVCNTS